MATRCCCPWISSSEITAVNVHLLETYWHYESQQAALVAVDLIMSRYEGEIWHGDSHLYLSHQQGETIDRDLFNSRYSTRVMIATSYEYMFRIDLFVKNKEDWIFNYGSDLLQQSMGSSLVVITASVSTVLVGLFTILYVLYVAQLSV